MKKLIVVGVILLFLSITTVPIIFSQVAKASQDIKYNEVDQSILLKSNYIPMLKRALLLTDNNDFQIAIRGMTSGIEKKGFVSEKDINELILKNNLNISIYYRTFALF